VASKFVVIIAEKNCTGRRSKAIPHPICGYLIEFKVSRPHGNYLQAAESESHTETKEDLSILAHNMNQPANFDVQTNVLEFSYTHMGYQEAPKFKLSLAAHGRRT
jgi:hypothetical protein